MAYKVHDTAHRAKQKQVIVVENGVLYLVTEDDKAEAQATAVKSAA